MTARRSGRTGLAVPQEQLDNFQSRLARTRWPDEVAREAELNAIPRRTLWQWLGRRPLPSALPPSRA